MRGDVADVLLVKTYSLLADTVMIHECCRPIGLHILFNGDRNVHHVIACSQCELILTHLTHVDLFII